MFVKVYLLLLLAISFTQEGTRACNITVHPGKVTVKEGETATLYCNANKSISRNTSANVTVTTNVGANTSVIASTRTCVIASTSIKPVSASVIASSGTSVHASMYANASAGVSASVSTKSVSANVSASSSTNASTTSVNASCSCNQSAPENCASWILSNQHSRISFGACNESLIIENVNRTDSGVYRCEDNAVTLDVLFAPEIITHPQNVTQKKGNPVKLSCDAIGNPVPTIWWTRDESLLAGDARISGVDNDTLTIKYVSSADGGSYRCVASNCVANTTSEAAILNVLLTYPPWITSHPQSETITEGSSVTFSCEAMGDPSPSISWTKDGSFLSNVGDPRITFTELNRKLTITNVNRTDGGEYRCVASNSCGQAISNPATLNVQSGPDQPLTVKVDFKGSRVVNISWTAVFHGSSELLIYTVEISEDNKTFGDAKCKGLSNTTCVVSGNSTSASLEGLHPGRTYYIRLFATTKVGIKVTSSVVNATTDEEEPHAPPVNLQGHNTSSTSLWVQWGEVPSADQNGIIRSYTVTYKALPNGSPKTKVVNAPTNQTTLTGLNEYTNYSITVFASTVKGDGNVSSPIIVITDEDRPGSAPQNVRGYNTSSTSILVSWDEVPADQQNGIITQYTIIYQSQTGDHNGSVSAGANDRQKYITGLKEYVNYNITVLASTVKGDGPHSTPVLVVKTDQDEPSAPPANVHGHNTSSTSILVQWGEVPAADQNGIILSYTVTYKALPSGSPQTEVVNASTNQTTLTGLNEYTNYSITVYASTVKGDGNVSSPIIVITDEDKPNASPLHLRPVDTTLTSILVTWDEVPAADQNGIILTYNVRYQMLGEGGVNASINSTTVVFPTQQANLTGLQNDTRYNISVLASTIKGDGPYSQPIIVSSNQDKPSAPPENVQGHNSTSTSIFVEWDEVPAENQNGEILNYTVMYGKAEGGEAEKRKQVNSPSRNVQLTNLTKYTSYRIKVLAATVKGDGPPSDPIQMRTDEDKPSSSPTITNVTVLSSTSVLVIWKPVPAKSRHGIIVQYTVHYKDVKKEKEGTMVVKAPVLQATVNGLRQKAEYTFWIVAATSKGNGPVIIRSTETATTGAVPTVKPPNEDDIGTTAVTVLFHNTTHLSNGSPVSYFQMIATTDINPGNPADEHYEDVTRGYEDQVQGEPYITAEFAKEDAGTTFTVGDGKYYSRNGVTETRRKDVSSFTVYLNGKLNDNTKYAVFQRSFDKDGDYENEGFIEFTTKKGAKQTQSKEKSPLAIIVTVVVVFLFLLLVACATVIWYRRSRRNAGRIVPDHEETKASSKYLHNDPKEEIRDMPGKYHSSEDPTQQMTA